MNVVGMAQTTPITSAAAGGPATYARPTKGSSPASAAMIARGRRALLVTVTVGFEEVIGGSFRVRRRSRGRQQAGQVISPLPLQRGQRVAGAAPRGGAV